MHEHTMQTMNPEQFVQLHYDANIDGELPILTSFKQDPPNEPQAFYDPEVYPQGTMATTSTSELWDDNGVSEANHIGRTRKSMKRFLPTRIYRKYIKHQPNAHMHYTQQNDWSSLPSYPTEDIDAWLCLIPWRWPGTFH